jgi:hypothetical protein
LRCRHRNPPRLLVVLLPAYVCRIDTYCQQGRPRVLARPAFPDSGFPRPPDSSARSTNAKRARTKGRVRPEGYGGDAPFPPGRQATRLRSLAREAVLSSGADHWATLYDLVEANCAGAKFPRTCRPSEHQARVPAAVEEMGGTLPEPQYRSRYQQPGLVKSSRGKSSRMKSSRRKSSRRKSSSMSMSSSRI